MKRMGFEPMKHIAQGLQPCSFNHLDISILKAYYRTWTGTYKLIEWVLSPSRLPIPPSTKKFIRAAGFEPAVYSSQSWYVTKLHHTFYTIFTLKNINFTSIRIKIWSKVQACQIVNVTRKIIKKINRRYQLYFKNISHCVF